MPKSSRGSPVFRKRSCCSTVSASTSSRSPRVCWKSRTAPSAATIAGWWAFVTNRARPGRQEFDPSYEAVYGAYTACFNDYVRRELKYESDLPYNALTGEVQPWNYNNVQNEYLNTSEMLHRAMSRNTNLKVWIANGYYDLATPYFATDYTVREMGLDPAVRGNINLTFYEGGHMMYMVPAELAKSKADAVKFYDATLKAAGVR